MTGLTTVSDASSDKEPPEPSAIAGHIAPGISLAKNVEKFDPMPEI